MWQALRLFRLSLSALRARVSKDEATTIIISQAEEFPERKPDQ